jgi:hypothetical protein
MIKVKPHPTTFFATIDLANKFIDNVDKDTCEEYILDVSYDEITNKRCIEVYDMVFQRHIGYV